jgi:hypothetical protein
MSNKSDRHLEELLAWTLPHIDEPIIKEAEAAPPVALPTEVRMRVLAKSETASKQLLAQTILAAANEVGETRETLLDVSAERREEVADLLDGAGNPHRVGAATLARLFGRVRLLPVEWRELVIQAVARSAVFYPETSPDFGVRALAGQASDRADAESARNAHRAKTLALDFADEVEREWQRLD